MPYEVYKPFQSMSPAEKTTATHAMMREGWVPKIYNIGGEVYEVLEKDNIARIVEYYGKKEGPA